MLPLASSPTSLAASIVVHTIEEALSFPAYQNAIGMEPKLTAAEVLLDSLPIFLLLIVTPYLQDRLWSGVQATLASVCVFHPLSDHIYFSYKLQVLRPGSTTAIAGLLPLGILAFVQEADCRSHFLGIVLGMLISWFLHYEVAVMMKSIALKK